MLSNSLRLQACGRCLCVAAIWRSAFCLACTFFVHTFKKTSSVIMSLKQKHHVFQFHMWCLFTVFLKNACENSDRQRLLPAAVSSADREGLLLHRLYTVLVCGCYSERGLCIAYLVFCCLLNSNISHPFSDLYFSSPVEQPCIIHYPQLRRLSENKYIQPSVTWLWLPTWNNNLLDLPHTSSASSTH